MSDSETNSNCNSGGNVVHTQNQNNELVNDTAGPKAPTELLAEFLSAVMIKDYHSAFKYCSEILNYEPNNTTARDFYPLILEKLEMISNEDYDDSSSASSDSFSSDSKSSGNSITPVDSQSPDEERTLSSGDENYSSLERKTAVKNFNGSLDPNFITEEKQSVGEKMEAKDSVPNKENSVNVLPSEVAKDEEPQTQAPEGLKPLSSSLLIHPTKTKILKSSSVSTEEKKKQNRLIKAKQKEQETSVVPQNQSSSKILLYPTRTTTFPKMSSNQNLSRIENPQSES